MGAAQTRTPPSPVLCVDHSPFPHTACRGVPGPALSTGRMVHTDPNAGAKMYAARAEEVDGPVLRRVRLQLKAVSLKVSVKFRDSSGEVKES